MSCYIEAAIACLESENLDTVFAFEMMDLAIKILLAVSCFEFIDYFNYFSRLNNCDFNFLYL